MYCSVCSVLRHRAGLFYEKVHYIAFAPHRHRAGLFYEKVHYIAFALYFVIEHVCFLHGFWAQTKKIWSQDSKNVVYKSFQALLIFFFFWKTFSVECSNPIWIRTIVFSLVTIIKDQCFRIFSLVTNKRSMFQDLFGWSKLFCYTMWECGFFFLRLLWSLPEPKGSLSWVIILTIFTI